MLHYYKYLNENNEVIQLEKTERIIHCGSYDFVFEITEEEYNEHLAAIQQAFEELN